MVVSLNPVRCLCSRHIWRVLTFDSNFWTFWMLIWWPKSSLDRQFTRLWDTASVPVRAGARARCLWKWMISLHNAKQQNSLYLFIDLIIRTFLHADVKKQQNWTLVCNYFAVVHGIVLVNSHMHNWCMWVAWQDVSFSFVQHHFTTEYQQIFASMLIFITTGWLQIWFLWGTLLFYLFCRAEFCVMFIWRSACIGSIMVNKAI